jgi:hypothetical protein
MKKYFMKKYLPVILLIVLGITCRLLPHPVNFAPIGAIAIFGAMYLPKKWLVLPIATLLISDLFIGFYSLPIMIAVYGSFLIMWFIGSKIAKNKKFHTILGGTILGSVLFFAITNWAVWAFGTMYIHNFSGLLQSYYMAMPFFRNSFLGDLFYVTLMVGAMESIIYLKSQRDPLETKKPELAGVTIKQK